MLSRAACVYVCVCVCAIASILSRDDDDGERNLFQLSQHDDGFGGKFARARGLR